MKGLTVFPRIILFCVLFATWMVFSGYTEPFFVVSGLICCAIVEGIVARMDRIDGKRVPLMLTWQLPGYVLWLAKEIALSSIQVTRKVWEPRISVTPTVAWVHATQQSPVGLTTYANSITLTPGTVSVIVEDDRIQVHALEQESIAALHKGAMDNRVSLLVVSG